ncbi:MAG: flagellar hook-length control protein FliK [Thiobacillaceae bacterium]
MPAILIDSPISTPPAGATQSVTDSSAPANDGQSFKDVLVKEMSNQVPETKNEAKPGKGGKAADGKAKDTDTPDTNAVSANTQPDLAALQIPLTSTAAANPTDPAKGDTQEPMDSARIKQRMGIDLKSATKQNPAGDIIAMQPIDTLQPGSNIKVGGTSLNDQGPGAGSKDSKFTPPDLPGTDQQARADNTKAIHQAAHDKLTIRQDGADALAKTAEQPKTLETVKSDSLSLLSSDIRAPANQPLAPVQTQSLPSQPTTRFDAQIGTTAWNNALGQQVVMMVAEKQQQAEIHLNPAEMGPIRITLTLDNNQASLSFLVHQSATREAIESALPRLSGMMAESGITLGQTNVQADTSGSFTQSGQSGGANWTRLNQPVKDIAVPQVQGAVRTISRQGLVDRFA